MSKLCAYGTDFHGKIASYRQFFKLSHAFGVKAIVLGGDLTPTMGTIRTSDGHFLPTDLDNSTLNRSQLSQLLRQTALQGAVGHERFVEEEGRAAMESAFSLDEICRQQELLARLQIMAQDPWQSIFTPEELPEVERLLLPAVRSYEASLKSTTPIDLMSALQPVSATDLNDPAAIGQLLLAKSALEEYSNRLPWVRQELAYQSLSQDAQNIEVFSQYQRSFLRDFLLPEIAAYKEAHPNAMVYAQFGNDDIRSNEDLFLEADRAGLLHYLHGRVLPFIGGLNIAGLSYASNVPAQYKEWERSEVVLAQELSALAQLSDPKRTVYVLHMPPSESMLDKIEGGFMGSKAVANFISQFGPHEILTGHVHQGPYLSGSFFDKVGETTCMSPGGWHNRGQADTLIFDPLDPLGSHTWVATSKLLGGWDLASLVRNEEDVMAGGMALRILLNADEIPGCNIRDPRFSLRGRVTGDIDIYSREKELGCQNRDRTTTTMRSDRNRDSFYGLDVFSSQYVSKLTLQDNDILEVEMEGNTYRVSTPEFFIVSSLDLNPGIWDVVYESIIALNLKYSLRQDYLALLLQRAKIDRYISAKEILEITDAKSAKRLRKRIIRRLEKENRDGTMPRTALLSFMMEHIKDLSLPITNPHKLALIENVLSQFKKRKKQSVEFFLTILLASMPDVVFSLQRPVYPSLEKALIKFLSPNPPNVGLALSFCSSLAIVNEFIEEIFKKLGNPKGKEEQLEKEAALAFLHGIYAFAISTGLPKGISEQCIAAIQKEMALLKKTSLSSYRDLCAHLIPSHDEERGLYTMKHFLSF